MFEPPPPSPPPTQFSLRTMLLASLMAAVAWGLLVNGLRDPLVLAMLVALGLMLATSVEWPAHEELPNALPPRFSPLTVVQGVLFGSALIWIVFDLCSGKPPHYWYLVVGGALVGVALSVWRGPPAAMVCNSLWKSGTAILIGYMVLTSGMIFAAVEELGPHLNHKPGLYWHAVQRAIPFWRTGIPYELAGYAILLAAASCVLARKLTWQFLVILSLGFVLSLSFALQEIALTDT